MSATKNFGLMEPEDMIVLDEAAARVRGPQPAPFRYFHAEILRRRPDVNAIVHTHDIYGRAFAQAGVPAWPVWRNGAGLVVEPMPVFPEPDLLFDEGPRTGAADLLAHHTGLHELSHGTDFVAATLEEAAVRAVHREELLRMQFLSLQLGEPRRLSEETIRDLTVYGPDYATWWEFYAAQLMQPAGVQVAVL